MVLGNQFGKGGTQKGHKNGAFPMEVQEGGTPLAGTFAGENEVENGAHMEVDRSEVKPYGEKIWRGDTKILRGETISVTLTGDTVTAVTYNDRENPQSQEAMGSTGNITKVNYAKELGVKEEKSDTEGTGSGTSIEWAAADGGHALSDKKLVRPRDRGETPVVAKKKILHTKANCVRLGLGMDLSLIHI